MGFNKYLISLLLFVVFAPSAWAVDSVRVPHDTPAIDLTNAVEKHAAEGDRLQVSTAPGSDGITRRIEVEAKEPGTHPSWIVFALTNDTDEQIERLIVAPHFRMQDSGLIWPDLGATRISTITASQGFPGLLVDLQHGPASPSIPARPSHMSRSCARRTCRSSICGSRTPIRKKSPA